jgi:hypothetical protein
MALGRRQFVLSAAAGLVVYGLETLVLAGDAEQMPGAPAWFRAALDEARTAKCPCIAIVLPGDKEAREALRERIQTLLRRPQPDAQAALVEAVYVLADPGLVGARQDDEVVLLDADGRRAAGARSKFDARFASELRPWLRGSDLAARADAARTREIEDLLDDLRRSDESISAAATRPLAERFPAVAAVVADAWEKSGLDADKARLARASSVAFGLRRGDFGTAFEKPLPFGARWKVQPSPKGDPCLGCGMMAVTPRSRELLEFLADLEPKAK